jgi:DNA primase
VTYSPATIACIRKATDLGAHIGEDVPLTQDKGAPLGMLTGVCPRCCSDRFHVNSPRGFYICFGCKADGSAIDWMMTKGLTFPEAIRALAKRAGVVALACP